MGFEHFLLRQMLRLLERLMWRPPETILACVGPFLIVIFQPLIQVALQFLDRVVDFLAERNLVKLFLDRAVEALADPVGLVC